MQRFVMWWISICLFVFMSASTAYAHANLLDSTPKNNEVLQKSPKEITLKFSEPLDLELVDLHLYDWQAHTIPLPRPQLTPGDASQMHVSVPALNDGRYTVGWSVVSEDGHPVSGSITFSVGKVTTGNSGISFSPYESLFQTVLFFLRYFIEGILLLGTGLFWISWLAKRRGFPVLSQITRRWTYIGIALFAGLITEWIAYFANLPDHTFISAWRAGEWKLLWQPPFSRMIIIQLLLVILLALPNMVEGWYLLCLTLLACTLAIGGHVWGIEPVWLASAVRAIHLLSISLWLGGLTYLLLSLQGGRLITETIDLAAFRPFFVRIALVASTMVALTGIVMVFLQTGWRSLVQNGSTWGSLLFLKIALFVLMLILALRQTLRWRKTGQTISGRLLLWEWAIGVMVILASVLMSQIDYPLPLKSYAKMLQAENGQAYVEISNLYVGKQKMTIHLQTADGKEPQKVTVEMNVPAHNIEFDPSPAQKIGSAEYQADLPFTMAGTWEFSIDAEFREGTHVRWSDKVFIPGGE
jgi:copper transport protein